MPRSVDPDVGALRLTSSSKPLATSGWLASVRAISAGASDSGVAGALTAGSAGGVAQRTSGSLKSVMAPA